MTLASTELKQRKPRSRGKLETSDQPADDVQMSTAQRRIPAWGVLFWLGIIHTGLLVAPFVFTWQGLVLAVVLHWMTGGLGICLGYHRLLTHTSFQTHPMVRWTCALLGGLAGEGSAVEWVANHRKHHALSDQPGDPHSPREGAWWSHILWLSWSLPRDEHEAHLKKWVPDLLKDKVIVKLGQAFIPIHIVSGLAIMAAGYALGGWFMATSFVVWGVFVRLVFVLHSTWFVNSASHIWGYRNYDTTDDSKNNWWVAIITYGEGWHNNHHAYPRMAPHGHRWWEIDMTFAAIRVLRMLGLAWDVVDYKHKNDLAKDAA